MTYEGREEESEKERDGGEKWGGGEERGEFLLSALKMKFDHNLVKQLTGHI